MSAEFPIVGIGASAGGIDAFHSFFNHMPSECGMAFVMVLHLPADRKSMLTEILSRWTSMPVLEAVDGMHVKPNHVYVPPPHAIVTLIGGTFGIQMPDENGERVLRPIDAFFDALAGALRERAVGIVLSGTGSDGALGLKAIKECGGLTIAQGNKGAMPQYAEMPAGAIATGAVDLICPVEEMPRHLVSFAHFTEMGFSVDRPGSDQMSAAESTRLEICAILREQLGHDFSDYRGQTFLRRVQRRMQVHGVASIGEYGEKLRSEPAEVDLLFRDLLIRVTSFFRDKETFQALATKVMPLLFEGKMADGTVRLWVPGCATGEEAYSLAMLLREHMDTLPVEPKVQLFATDIDESSITTARLGRYPKILVEGLSQERLQRFFTFSHGSYSVAKEIRDLCTFSVHSLVRDPPFSMMNLVSCRNLLIYLNPDLQARIIPLFHYALIPGGILLLGSSESVAQHPELFETLDKGARIFRRRQGRSPELSLSWQNTRLSSYMQHDSAGGRMSESPSLAPARMTVVPPNRGLSPSERFKQLLGPMTLSEETLAQVQGALAATCEELQSLAEEHQTALEELRSANEELHSVNEEMQSTNEELETSKEELQSLNEELHTVNMRLTEKIEELNNTNSDLRNLFESIQIATVFLDRHLLIRSFTPAIVPIYNLIPSDQGRSLIDIASHLQYTGLREDVAFVLSTLGPLERRVVRDDRSTHYIMRILPYREPDNMVSGVLVTFIDVTSIVHIEEALVAADVRKDVFLATLSHELRNPLAPIRISAQLLQSPRLSPEELERAQAIIARQVTHMSSLLDDLLDVSRITRGSFLLKKEYVDVRVLMHDAVEAVQGALDAKRHTLRVQNPESPVVVEVDAVRITQVLTNLLTNAAKYTPAGGVIHLEARLGAQFLEVSVRDNGIGMTTEAMSKIFDMFTRIDSEVARSEGGLGIGLALARGLVKLHGGRLEVTSRGAGQGSEFVVYLPRSLLVDASATQALEGDVPPHAQARRILIADDNQDNAESLMMLLKLSGHDVYLAHSGTEALETAKRVRPDIGVFDIGMPDLNGYELAERIRHEAWGANITLIAMTGWGQDSDKRRALAAGFDHHLTKPVDPDDLEALFEINS